MLFSRIGRIAATALIVITPLIVVGSFAGPATAAGLKIKCTGFTATVGGNSQYTGCTAAATGGSSIPVNAGSCQANCTATTNWVNGKSTSVSYNAPLVTRTICPVGDLQVAVSGHVTADSTGFAPVGGSVKGTLCVAGGTTVTLAPGTTFKFK